MRRHWPLIGVGLLLAALAVAAIACGDGKESASPTATTGGQTPQATQTAVETSQPTAETPTPSEGATVIATENSQLGTILTDSEGRTLYKFADDQPSVSNCAGPCAQAWPPLTIASGTPTAGAGVTGELDTIQRSDAATQVTHDGSPLYRYSGDAAAGDTNGNGLLDKWSVINLGG